MRFARIEMLFLIWAIPVLFMVFLYGVKKHRRILSRFSSPRGLKAIVPDMSKDRLWIRAGLILSAVLFVTLALTGPQYGYKWQEIERKGIDIVIALDCSRSMLAQDIKPTRLDRAKREIFDLLTLLKGDRVGLVAFAGTAFLQCPLTLDYDALHLFLNALSPDFLPLGGTDINGAVLTALDSFDEKSNSEKAVILITDGENTGEREPMKAADSAKKDGIKLFCIGVGKVEGVPVPNGRGGFKKDESGKIILTKLDEETLKKMAVLTGGTYVRSVAGDMDLDAIYTKEIRGKMEHATLSSGRKQVWEDRYQWVLIFAIFALMVEMFLSSRKKNGAVIVMLIALFLTQPVFAGNLQDGLDAYEKEDYETALKFFIDAQLENPENPEILYNIGNAYYKIGDFESAFHHYQEALKSKNKALKHKALYNLGNTSYRRHQIEDAIKKYEEALKIDPDDEQARQNLEFVKKMLAKKKAAQTQQQKGDAGNASQKKESDQTRSDSENSSKDANKTQDKTEPSNGNKSDEPESIPNQNQPSPEKMGSEDKKTDQRESGHTKAAAAGEHEDPGRKQQLERILNRLKDQPGKAMIPAYGERKVEKDW